MRNPMAYVLSDIVTKVQQRVRDTNYSSTEIKNYINDAQNDIFNEFKLPQLQATQNYTLTINESDITNGSGLPSDYVQAVNLVITADNYERPLTYVDFREIDRFDTDPDDTDANPANVPDRWYYYNDTIRVFPVPSSAFTVTLKYYKRPTELSSDSDVPQVPKEFEELLVLGAAYRVLQVKDNYDQAGILENSFIEKLQKLVNKYSRPQVGKPTKMRINRYAIGKTSY